MTQQIPEQHYSLKNVLTIAVAYQLALVLLVALLLKFTGQGMLPGRLAGLFGNWDARLYLYIAAHGYETSGDPANFIVFFPLFPILIWLLSFLLNPIVAGIVITNIASVIGHAYFILFLQERGYCRQKIWRILLLLLFSPVSVYFTLNYTEGVLLGLSAVFLYYLEQRKLLGAAVLGCFASMTKLIGILFLIPYIFYCVSWRPFKIKWPELFYAAIIPLGYGFYSLINYKRFGDGLHYMLVQRDHWSKQSVNPFRQYWYTLFDVLHGNHFEEEILKQTYTFDYIALLIAPIIIIAYVLLRRNQNKLPFSLVLWSLAQLLVFCSQSYWMSSFRYAALILPLYIMIEEVTYRIRPVYYSVLLISALGSIYCCYIFTTGWWLL
jgi:hypothetical protein